MCEELMCKLLKKSFLKKECSIWCLKLLGYCETPKCEGSHYSAIWVRLYNTTVEVQYTEHTPLTETHVKVTYSSKKSWKFFDISTLRHILHAVDRFVLLQHP